MQPFKTQSFRVFLMLYSFFFCIGLITLSIIDKGDLVLFLNKLASPGLDIFFKLTTLLGLGGVFAIPILMMLFYRFTYAIAGTLSLLLTGLFTYLGKQVLFNGMPRPTAFFTNDELSHFIEGFTYHHSNSFPSGHTMTAFALASFLAIIINHKSWSVVIVLIAITIGISRVYLLQHFLMDIIAGSILGLLCTLIAIYLSSKLEKKHPKLSARIPIKKAKLQ